MRRYLVVVAGLVALLLAMFAAVEALGVAVLVDPRPHLERGGVPAALLGVGLLVVDVAVPVPSSLVMVAHGALFGLVVGAVLSLTGSTAAAVAGAWLGRRGGPLLGRVVGEEERVRADRLLHRWGSLAVVVTRPVPLLAETVAILAGASRLSLFRVTLAAAVGSLPAAVLYAAAGALAATFANTVVVFALVLLLAVVFWALTRAVEVALGARVPDEGERR